MDGSKQFRLSLALLVGAASSAWAQYQAVPLGSLGGSFGASIACVNNNGDAVGVSDTNAGVLRGFYWHDGTMT